MLIEFRQRIGFLRRKHRPEFLRERSFAEVKALLIRPGMDGPSLSPVDPGPLLLMSALATKGTPYPLLRERTAESSSGLLQFLFKSRSARITPRPDACQFEFRYESEASIEASSLCRRP
jgi:hypothetical protein